MELNFENKYKDRTPEETCAIIKDFFISRGYTIDIFPLKSDIELYSYHILLKKNGFIVLFSNGKGMTDAYAEASGLAELYERFCNFGVYMWSPMFWEKRKELGINFNNEAKLNLDDILNIPIINQRILKLGQHNPDKAHSLLNDMKYNDFFGVPYTIIESNETIYLDPVVITKINLSTGMSAGNTFEEAFVQGSSEILERFVTYNFFINPPKKLYQINDNILSMSLQEKIKKLNSQDKQVYIFDLSYNYMLPVVLTLVIDKKRHFSRINFASNPIFEIAVERTFTEMYQNVSTMIEKWIGIQTPYYMFSGEKILYDNATGLRDVAIFPEYLLNNIEIISKCGNYFNDNSFSNIDIFKWMKKLFNDAKIDICYRDCSLSNQITALHIVALNLSVNYDVPIQMKEKDWIDYQKRYDAFNSIFKELIKEKYNLSTILNKVDYLLPSSQNSSFYWEIAARDCTNPLETRSTDILYIIFEHFNVPNDMINVYSDSIYYYQLMKFIFIKDYLRAKYSAEEIIDYGEIFGFSDIKFADIENINNFEYLLEEIWVKPIHSFYHSRIYEEIIRSFV